MNNIQNESGNQDPLISIICPIYNAEAELPRCVDSVLAQTHRNIELVLVNDGSTDRSGEICDEYAAKDNRVRAIHKENGGASAARNAGLDAAHGDYIGFVDSDDWINSDMYERLLRAIAESGAQVAVCGYTEVSTGNLLRRVMPIDQLTAESADMLILPGREMLCAMLEGRAHWLLWNMLYRASILKGVRFDPKQLRANDLYYSYFAFKCVERAVLIPDGLYNYIRRPGSLADWTPLKPGFSCHRLRVLQIIAKDARESHAVPDHSVIALGIGFYKKYRDDPKLIQHPQYARAIRDFLWKFYGLRIVPQFTVSELARLRRTVISCKGHRRGKKYGA